MWPELGGHVQIDSITLAHFIGLGFHGYGGFIGRLLHEVRGDKGTSGTPIEFLRAPVPKSSLSTKNSIRGSTNICRTQYKTETG